MKHHNPNMLLKIAQGDAYCIATEYTNSQYIVDEALKFERYVKRLEAEGEAKHNMGHYSDDTQMSGAVAEVLLGNDFSAFAFASSFFNCFKRYPIDGYSRAFQKILEDSVSVEDMLTKLVPASDKNGAAMRSVPIGVISNIETIKAICEVQARITHDTDDGVISSQAVGLMSHYWLYGGEIRDMREFLHENLREFVVEDFDFVRLVGPRVGIKTAVAVYRLLASGRNLDGMLRKIIEDGGDTDSVAAIAIGIGSSRVGGMEEWFYEGMLEDGEYGKRYLVGLGGKLMAKYGNLGKIT